MLQPYVQSTVASRSSQKLSLRFYGSFKTIQRVGQVPYELNFLIDAKIHPVVHVSQLKQHIPAIASVSSDLSSVSSDPKQFMWPRQILEKRFIGAENDQHVNICSFAVRCDRMWPSTQ